MATHEFATWPSSGRSKGATVSRETGRGNASAACRQSSPPREEARARSLGRVCAFRHKDARGPQNRPTWRATCGSRSANSRRAQRYSRPWCAGKPGRQLVNDRLEALVLSNFAPLTDIERRSLVGSALQLSYFTIVWNGVVGAIALAVGLTTGSLALAGFALNALLDSSASVVLVWRFRKERSDPVAAERLERRAQTWVIVAMMLVALYVGFEAIRALLDGSHPESSAFGFGIAAISLLVLPVLGVMKLRLANLLRSAALRGDGVLTLAAACLAAITLVALLTNSLLDWWWADPAAALLIAIALATEATRVAVRHRFG